MSRSGPGEPGGPFQEGRGFWPEWLTPRRIFEFVRNVVRLERSVETLKADKTELERKLTALQRQVDEQSGQLSILLNFVGRALDEQVRARAREAATEVFESMASKGVSGGKAKAPPAMRGRDTK